MAEVRRLPALREGDWDWQVRAACRGTDTANFYHPENERGPSRARREMAGQGRLPALPGDRELPALGARRPRALRRVGRPVGRGARSPARQADRLTRPPRDADPKATAPRPHVDGCERDGSRWTVARRERRIRSRGRASGRGRAVAVPVRRASCSSSAGFSTTALCVVSTSAATEAALASAALVTFTGSTTPAASRSTYSPVAALRPWLASQVADLRHDDVALEPGVVGDPAQRLDQRRCGRSPRRSPRRRSGRGRRRAPRPACTRAAPPPAMMPSSTAARVAEMASSMRCLRSLSSTSVAAPTLMTPTPPASLASRSCSFSRSQSESVSSISRRICAIRSSISSCVAGAVGDRGGVLGDDDAPGPAEHVQAGLVELEPDLGRDDLGAGDDRRGPAGTPCGGHRRTAP